MFPNQFSDSLWGDEAFSAILSQKPLGEMIKIVAHDTSPPLYYLIEHYWFKLVGNSEVAIRSLSFLFHLGTVMAVFLLAKFLWDKRTALWAAILGFLNPFLFTYAFEGRMYTLLAFTTTLSFYGYFRAFYGSTTKNIKWKLFYALAVAMALYSHHFALFAILVQGVWLLPLLIREVLKPRSLKKIFSLTWPFLLITGLYLPWLPALYYQTMLVKGGFWLAKPIMINLLELIGKFLIGSQAYPLRTLTLTIVVMLFLWRRWQIKDKVDGILVSWFLLPLVFTWLISQITQSIFFDRYLLFTIPALALLLASQRRTLVSSFILVLLIIIFTALNWNYFTHPHKRPFKAMASYLNQEVKPTDALMNWNSAAHHLWESQYYGLAAPIYSPTGPLPFYVGTAQMTKEDVISTPPSNQRIGVITSGPVEEVQLSNYKQDEIRQFGNLKVIWLKKLNRQSTQ